MKNKRKGEETLLNDLEALVKNSDHWVFINDYSDPLFSKAVLEKFIQGRRSPDKSAEENERKIVN